MFHKDQIEVLLSGIRPNRVSQVQGMSHVEGYDIRAMLTRVFGFGMWDEEQIDPTEIVVAVDEPLKSGKPGVQVIARATRRLTVRTFDGKSCHYDGCAVGESKMPDFKRGDAYDMAIKTAETQALKRCAINLGDQFGLSLYNEGSTRPLVIKSWNGQEFQAKENKEVGE